MSGGVVAAPAGIVVSVAAGACIGAFLLVSAVVVGTAAAAKKVKKTADDAIEHKRNQILAGIDTVAQNALQNITSGLDGIKTSLQQICKEAEESEKKLKAQIEQTAKIKGDFTNNESNRLDQLFTVQDDQNLKKIIQETVKSQQVYNKAWESANAAYLESARNEAKRNVLENILNKTIEDIRQVIQSTGPESADILKTLDMLRESGNLQTALEKAKTFLSTIESQNEMGIVLDRLKDIRLMKEQLIFRSHELQLRTDDDMNELLKQVTGKQYATFNQKADDLQKKLLQMQSDMKAKDYRDREARYLALLNRYFHLEDPLKLVDAQLSGLIETLALSLDQGRYIDFDDAERQIEAQMLDCGRSTLAETAAEVFRDQKFEGVKQENAGKSIFVTGFKEGSPLTVQIDPQTRIKIDFPPGSTQDDQNCHLVLKTFVMGLRQKAIDKGLELNFLNLALKWRFGEELKMSIQPPTPTAPLTPSTMSQAQNEPQIIRTRPTQCT